MAKVERNRSIAPEEFDWDLYKDGYNGRNLKRNNAVGVKSAKGDKIVVYSHEHYASELLGKYLGSSEAVPQAKDLVVGAIIQISNVRPVSETELILDTVGGGSCRIDLNKEREYLTALNGDAKEFTDFLQNEENLKKYLDTKPVVRVMSKDRVSLWGGHIGRLEQELDACLRYPKHAFAARILETNNGGYIVNINGLECFMPGSQAAPGIIKDFQSLIGKVVPVMPINKIPGKGFVVSYKKYLASIMPNKVREELALDMCVMCTVTGCSKNGVFVQFNDKNGEPTFSGLVYRDEMSSFLEEEFDEGRIINGDMFRCYIHSIDIDGEKVRIVLGDNSIYSSEYQEKKMRLERAKERARKEEL